MSVAVSCLAAGVDAAELTWLPVDSVLPAAVEWCDAVLPLTPRLRRKDPRLFLAGAAGVPPLDVAAVERVGDSGMASSGGRGSRSLLLCFVLSSCTVALGRRFAVCVRVCQPVCSPARCVTTTPSDRIPAAPKWTTKGQ